MSVLKIFDGQNWQVVGLQGTQGSTGMPGVNGLIGITGIGGTTGLVGLQGQTGSQIIMDQMLVQRAIGITGVTPTGVESLNYMPITGLKTSISLSRPGKVMSLLYLKYKNASVGTHTVSYLLQSNGETGPYFSDYLSDTKEKSEVLYQVTSDLPIGTHNIQAFWKLDSTGKRTELLNGDLASIVLEGSYGVTGIQGITGVGVQGLVGTTGAYGGPPGVTGFQGTTGIAGALGATGPGLLGYDTFVKIIPMESWRTINVDSDVYSGIPVLRFDSIDSEEIDTTIVTPREWDHNSNLSIRIGSIINLPLAAGAQLIYQISYIGFNKTINIATLGAYHTNSFTHTLTSPIQFDFVETLLTMDKSYIAGYDYIHLKIQKISGSPNVSIVGICSAQLEYPVNIGIGPTGPIGITGMVGTQGSTGAYGGPPGLTGFQGSTGSIGLTGSQGTTGSIGLTGSQGTTGIRGTTGSQGITGIIGNTGIMGNTGIQGITGIIGNTGVQGIQGIIGATGAYGGPPGETGIIGATGAYGGPPGVTGFQGSTGLQGQTGIQGFSEVSVAFANPLVINAAAGNIFEVTLTANTVINAPSNPSVKWIIFRFIQGGSGGFTVTWDSIFNFCDSLPVPVLSTVAGKRDYLQFIYNGTASKWDFVGEAYGHTG
jgi:collagen type VII alpha